MVQDSEPILTEPVYLDSHLILTPDGFKTWRLVSDFKTSYCTVPRGFITDLASVPRFLWTIIPPFGRYSQAAVVHDFLYEIPEYPRKEADRIFYIMMLEYGTYPWKARVMYWAVRVFGGFCRRISLKNRARRDKKREEYSF